MRLRNKEVTLLAHPSGQCKLAADVNYILYMKNNWKEVQEFCAPFKIEKTKINSHGGRAVIDLPSGNETFKYGMVLVRLGDKRIMVFSSSEFMELFNIE